MKKSAQAWVFWETIVENSTELTLKEIVKVLRKELGLNLSFCLEGFDFVPESERARLDLIYPISTFEKIVDSLDFGLVEMGNIYLFSSKSFPRFESFDFDEFEENVKNCLLIIRIFDESIAIYTKTPSLLQTVKDNFKSHYYVESSEFKTLPFSG